MFTISKRAVVVFVILLALIASACAAGGDRDPDPEPPKKDPFDRLTLDQVKRLVAGKAAAKIDGSDGRTNQVPAGTVLVYRTKMGRYGKCKVVKYGYNLELKWLTYDGNGKVFSKGNKLVVRGTFSCDLDGGKEARGGGGDFWWEQVSRQKRFLVPRGRAVVVVYFGK
jgi:hypothetical protein